MTRRRGGAGEEYREWQKKWGGVLGLETKKGRPWQVSLDTTTHNTILGEEGFPSSV